MSEEIQEVQDYLRKKKGGKRKCKQVSGYKRKVQKKGEAKDE